MPSISLPAVIGGVGAAASLGSALIGSSGAQDAAATQVAGAQQAAQLSAAAQAQTRADLTPYRDLGSAALAKLDQPTIDQFTNYDGSLLNAAYPENPTAFNTFGAIPGQAAYTPTPPRMSEAELASTPGYQFALSQGLQATQNSAAARGLGVSGAALKGAADYATGLADNTYQKQFAQQQQVFQDAFEQNQARFGNNQSIYADKANSTQQLFNQQGQRFNNLLNLNSANQGNLQQAYSRLTGLVGTGQNSAALTGTLNNQSAGQQATYLSSGANAAGASQIAQGNAISGGINGLANAGYGYLNYNRLYGAGSKGSYDPAFNGPGRDVSIPEPLPGEFGYSG